MPDGQVVFEITGDKKPISQTLKETTQEIEKESQKWDKSVKRSTDEMEKSFGKALDTQRIKNWALEAGRYVVDFAKQAISAASDLQEVQNVVDVTFGESGAGKIETWARKAGAQFGLTETQAKRFTSTLGAMMKSAGLAGPEIVNMSTDLAGLAADMASFYNLDFDTAFQKIRSGISGETEPLKQLGINMSVANLQAFALQKGITTAFDKMSQGEQTVLRYQYLMQATADAQGDFARTSDGYANSLRMFQTNIETLKTTLGSSFLDVVGQAVGGLNEFLALLLPDESKKTVLDDFNAIDLDTAEKLSQIRQTAGEARDLINVLNDIQGDVASKNLQDVAEAANELNIDSGSRWGNLVNALQDAGVIEDNFGSAGMGAAGANLSELAKTLSSDAPASEKVSAWKLLIDTLSDNADSLSAITGTGAAETAQWLNDLAVAADRINPNDASAWEALFDQLQRGLPNLKIDGTAEGISTVAEAAGALKTGASAKWESFISALQDAGVIRDVFGDKTLGDNVVSLVENFNAYAPGEDKAKAWRDMLGALKDNSDALAALTGQSATETAAWLDKMAAAANSIDVNSADAWAALIAEFEKGFPNVDFGDAAENLGSVADAAKKLGLSTGAKWRSLLDAMQDAGILKTSFNDATVAENIGKISSAFSDNALPKDKINAWDTLLSTLMANADGLSALSDQSAEETKKWLEDLAAGANQLDPMKAESWESLFTSLISGLPGLENSNAGKAFFDALTGNFLAMGNQSGEAASGLAALGLTTDEIDTKQKQWLETCRRLVQTIPGLNEIINTETGEVNGGTQAISDYVTEWQEAQEKMALWKAHYARGDALEERRSQEYLYQLDKMTAEERVKRLQAEYERLGGDDTLNRLFSREQNGILSRRRFALSDNEEEAAMRSAYIALRDARAEAVRAGKDYEKQVADNAAAVQAYVDEGEALKTQYGELADQAQGAAAETSALSDAQMDAATTAVQQLAPALAALADYYEDVRKATAQQVDSAIGGFEKIVTPAERTRAKLVDLNKQLAKAEDKSVIQIQIADANSSLPSIQNMTKALQDQLEYINEYQRNLDEARRRGVSEDLLATLSDGSVESADYLAALATAGKGEVEILNQAWKDVQAGKETFTDALTAQKLAADETFDGIVAKANETVTALDMADGARDALSSTIEGMALGISDALPSVTAQVDAVLEQMQRLSAFGGFSFSGGALAFGGSSGGVNYDALGDTIRSSAPKAGGSVYLNGRAVGAVVSAEMGNSYRALARSGVQYTSEP